MRFAALLNLANRKLQHYLQYFLQLFFVNAMRQLMKIWQSISFCLLMICVSGCQDEENNSPLPYDPNLPVTISDFSPHQGGAKTRMIIYGNNFGTDPSIISLKIGGKETKVINVKGDCLYCITPPMCYEGTIELKVGDSEPVIAPAKFEYEKKRTVSTLCGYVDELGKGDNTDEGSFDELEKIRFLAWLSFDPKNPDILYCTQENDGDNDARKLLKFDLKNEYLSPCFSTPQFGVHRLKSISWSVTADTMVIATTKGGGVHTSNLLLKRSDGFTNPQVLTSSESCPSSVIHPQTGDLYYGRFSDGSVYRYDIETNGLNNMDLTEYLFKLQDTGYSFNMVIHPSGDYMYIIVVNKHYIMRSNFDRTTNKFTVPYIVAGKVGAAGYEDKVGTSARFNNPYQGVFVKNPAYAGKADEYDFYFTDRLNHCIRILTPQGVVSTFAGRGSTGLNNQAKGYVDGDLRQEARFNGPRGIAYDEVNDIFYISDSDNFRMRKISYEFTDDADEPTDSEEPVDPDEGNSGNEDGGEGDGSTQENSNK